MSSVGRSATYFDQTQHGVFPPHVVEDHGEERHAGLPFVVVGDLIESVRLHDLLARQGTARDFDAR